MSRDRLLRAGAFLDKHLFDPIQPEDIAAASALSLRSLQRHFATAVGESLSGYLRGRRLTHAAQQLVLGHQDILSLALDCQFGSHEAFTRAFSRHFFMSPSAFRQQGCLQHNYYRPSLDLAMLDELAAQHQQPPQVAPRPQQSLWGVTRAMQTDELTGAGLGSTVWQLGGQLRSLFGQQAPLRVFYFKTQPGQCRHFLLLVATAAGRGTPPQDMVALTLPAGYSATFTLHGDESQLPVFMYHCFAQWIFHSGWHFDDAPIELQLPDERHPRFRLTLPVRTTPCPVYRLW